MKSESGAGQFASIKGCEMYFEVRGEGQPLILLHGFTGAGQTGDMFSTSMIWQRAYRLIIPDMRGHGGSTNPANEFTHRQSRKTYLRCSTI